MKRLRVGMYWLVGGAGLGVLGVLFFLWQPVIASGGFRQGKGVRDVVATRLPWLEPGIRRILFLPELSMYEQLRENMRKEIVEEMRTTVGNRTLAGEVTAIVLGEQETDISDNNHEQHVALWRYVQNYRDNDSDVLVENVYREEWKQLMRSNMNPLRYIELGLWERAEKRNMRLRHEQISQTLQDSRAAATVRLRPKKDQYDERTAGIEIAAEGGAAPVMIRLKVQFRSAPRAAVILKREEDGSVIGELKPVKNGDTQEMDIERLDELIDSTVKYRLDSRSPLGLTGVTIWISNGVTGEKAGSIEAQVVDEGTFRYLAEATADPREFAANNREFVLQRDHSVLFQPGSYVIDRVVIIPSTVALSILPGTTLRFMPGAALVSYGPVTAEGTKAAPIRFMSANGKPWGVFAVVHTKKDKSLLRHVVVEDAAPMTINGVLFSGGFSAHEADVEIYDSEFRRNHGDDGVNVKYAEVLAERNKFIDNDFDGMDLDVASGMVRDNEFSGNGNDGLDVSWNRAGVEENTMERNTDKCLSVGEKSMARINNNTMQNCSIGIAVKDLSEVEITGNRIEGNKQGIAIYQKKEIFGGGFARLHDNTFSGNGEDVFEDQQSEAIQ